MEADMYLPIVGSRWSLFDDLQRLQREVNRLFGGPSIPRHLAEFPLVSIVQAKDAVVLTAEVPGIDPKDLQLTVHRTTVSLGGSRPAAAAAAGQALHRQECFSGAFARVFELPCRVDAGAVDAVCKNGVLTVRMPRLAEDKPAAITVKPA